jgi:pyridinium-3,5-biscarboxylic acid mononucleotide synthase
LTPDALHALLRGVAEGGVAVDEALARLSLAPVEDLEFARVDHHRALRLGFPEVAFGEGKTPVQLVEIARRIVARGDAFLATRVAPAGSAALAAAFPEVELNAVGRTALVPAREPVRRRVRGSVLVVTAGTSDLPVAEEAAASAAAFGCPVERLTDVGVAGIHRVLQAQEALRGAAVVIVVAGMEGALPSVVGGLVSAPVIAVPTSVGYGAAFGGLAALLGMLNSCASGVTVVNIDNGFGAACAAARINLLPPD